MSATEVGRQVLPAPPLPKSVPSWIDGLRRAGAQPVIAVAGSRGKSTVIHSNRLLHEVHGRNKRKFYMLIDLQKAYDSVDRELLWKILKGRCQSDEQLQIVELITKLHRQSEIEIGGHKMNAEMGLPQGSILSPVLFNVYLEEALKSSDKLE